MILQVRVKGGQVMIMDFLNSTTHIRLGLFKSVKYPIALDTVNAIEIGPCSKLVVATLGEDGKLNYIMCANLPSCMVVKYI